MPLATVSGLYKQFAGVPVLEDVTLQVDEGHRIGLRPVVQAPRA